MLLGNSSSSTVVYIWGTFGTVTLVATALLVREMGRPQRERIANANEAVQHAVDAAEECLNQEDYDDELLNSHVESIREVIANEFATDQSAAESILQQLHVRSKEIKATKRMEAEAVEAANVIAESQLEIHRLRPENAIAILRNFLSQDRITDTGAVKRQLAAVQRAASKEDAVDDLANMSEDDFVTFRADRTLASDGSIDAAVHTLRIHTYLAVLAESSQRIEQLRASRRVATERAATLAYNSVPLAADAFFDAATALNLSSSTSCSRYFRLELDNFDKEVQSILNHENESTALGDGLMDVSRTLEAIRGWQPKESDIEMATRTYAKHNQNQIEKLFNAVSYTGGQRAYFFVSIDKDTQNVTGVPLRIVNWRGTPSLVIGDFVVTSVLNTLKFSATQRAEYIVNKFVVPGLSRMSNVELPKGVSCIGFGVVYGAKSFAKDSSFSDAEVVTVIGTIEDCRAFDRAEITQNELLRRSAVFHRDAESETLKRIELSD